MTKLPHVAVHELEAVTACGARFQRADGPGTLETCPTFGQGLLFKHPLRDDDVLVGPSLRSRDFLPEAAVQHTDVEPAQSPIEDRP